MVAVVEKTAKITAKGQTTVPKFVREALGVDLGGKIAFVVDKRGVVLRRVKAEATTEDPAIASFLAFLTEDIQQRPRAIKAFSPALVARIAALTEGVTVDLDAKIDGAVAL